MTFSGLWPPVFGEDGRGDEDLAQPDDADASSLGLDSGLVLVCEAEEYVKGKHGSSKLVKPDNSFPP